MSGNLTSALADLTVWWAIGVAVAFGGITLVLGLLAGSRLGLLHDRTPAGDRLGVGLGLGLLGLASAYALVVSRGMSSLTPIAVFLVLALVTAKGRPTIPRPTRRAVMVGLAAACVLAIIALFMTATIAPSPRDGTQPVEFMDEAFYARLAVDLDRTGREWVFSPSGYAGIPGAPAQSWYHWGEAWLAAVVMDVPGVSPMHARLIVVLPLILLTTFTLAGAACRKLLNLETTEAFMLGGLGALLLAPLPLVFGYHFDSYASPLLVFITRYGLQAVPLLLLVYLAGVRSWSGSWSESWLLASVAAAVVALHVALAPAALLAAAITVALVAIRSSSSIRSLARSPLARPLTIALMAVVGTLAWGFLTGHGVPTEARSVGVTAFDIGWQRSVLLTMLSSGVILLSLGGAWVLRRSSGPLWAMVTAVWVGVIVAATYWGWGYPALNSFHVFFGSVVLVLTPTAAIAIVGMIAMARRRQRRLLAHILLALLLVQVGLNAVIAAPRLNAHTGYLPPIPLSVLDAIRTLPSDARIAYSCGPVDEFAPWTPRLGTITVHTGRLVMPLCYMADPTLSLLSDRPIDPLMATPFTGPAQQSLFPTADAMPTADAIRSFMDDHGIEYVYVDAQHPDRLALDGPIIHQEGDVTIYRVPGVGFAAVAAMWSLADRWVTTRPGSPSTSPACSAGVGASRGRRCLLRSVAPW